jgi:DNA-binding transcriptional LysR family regulator
MDLDQLHTFLEIVRLKSFSKAAQTCYRTQPAISAQVRQLEQELGTQLFDRFGSRIALTTAGRIFADYAARILDLRKQAQDAINELERTPRGELVVAANEATWIYILPEVFSDYRSQFPHVQLLVERSYGSRILEAIFDNVADFGITQLPVHDRKLQMVKLHADEIRLIVPSGHELASAASVTARETARFPLILQKYGTTRTRLNEWLELVEDDVEVVMELDSTEMLKRFVAAGLGLGFMAETHCREEILAGRLRAVPLAPEPMVRTLALVYRKDKALSKAALGFIEVVLKHAGLGVARSAPKEARAARGGEAAWNAER